MAGAPLAVFTPLALRPEADVPLYRQLYHELRNAILAGRLAGGMQLPSTRVLADELSVSRTTVVAAFDQLAAEGYLESKVGSGTFVSSELPDDLLTAGAATAKVKESTARRRSLSRRGAILASTLVSTSPDQGDPRPFRPGLPALDRFPFDTWSRLTSRRLRCPPTQLLAYGDAAGYGPLREAITGYLSMSRGVRCEPAQVIVVSGSQQAFHVAASVLLDSGDPVWVENPGYMGARGALRGASAVVIPVPVDDQGLDLDAGKLLCPTARMVCVTPSHQYPLGVTMSLSRRLALLEWARQADAWVLEDDYDSEFRYSGRPLAALQGLDTDGRVVYIGTFSKVLFPALRLGYLVAPPDLVDAFVSARSLVDRHSPSLDQAVLADFIAEGHFGRHIRRMRALYTERQAALVEAAAHELNGLLDVRPSEAGMHLVGRLPDGVNDCAASERLAAVGIEAPPISAYALEPIAGGGLMLGYAAVNEDEIRLGVRGMVAVLTRTVVDRNANQKEM